MRSLNPQPRPLDTNNIINHLTVEEIGSNVEVVPHSKDNCEAEVIR